MDKKRILIVDDEASFTRLVKLNLEKTGVYEVAEENRGAAGVETARQFRPDLILLDVVMPDKDGGELLAEMQADDELKDIPVIFLTATMSQEGVDARKGSIGGRPFIAKPVELKQLARRIEQTLNQKK